MSGYNAGTAYISVRPDFSDFQSDIKAEMAEQGQQAEQAFADAFKAEIDTSLDGMPPATIAAEADTGAAVAELDDIARPRTAEVGLDDEDANDGGSRGAAGAAG